MTDILMMMVVLGTVTLALAIDVVTRSRLGAAAMAVKSITTA